MNTHKIAFVLGLAICSQIVYAEGVRENLLGSSVEHGGFGGPQFSVTQLQGETNYLMGGKGAWLMNHAFYIGGGGFASMIGMDKHNASYDFGYGGLIAGYIGNPNKLVHFAVDVLLGGGGVTGRNERSGGMMRADSVLVFEPKVYAAVNLAEHAQLNLGVGY
ncbi:MAG: hypothetical protein OEW08_13060, partial [Gammaproteobacteria bacterium]|nr:hypothetical protein [Gammaproteobacteria bacterium]